jgi:hypothetical protein
LDDIFGRTHWRAGTIALSSVEQIFQAEMAALARRFGSLFAKFVFAAYSIVDGSCYLPALSITGRWTLSPCQNQGRIAISDTCLFDPHCSQECHEVGLPRTGLRERLVNHRCTSSAEPFGLNDRGCGAVRCSN